jgi:hypothetical protein
VLLDVLMPLPQECRPADKTVNPGRPGVPCFGSLCRPIVPPYGTVAGRRLTARIPAGDDAAAGNDTAKDRRPE